MVITKRFPTHYYTLLDFPVVMAVVVFILLTTFMVEQKPMHGASVDLPRVSNPASMPRFESSNAMHMAIMRDGTIYFGQDKISTPEQLSHRIQEGMRLQGVEKQVYIKADCRTRYGNVSAAIDAIHDAGVEKVAFMTDQRKPGALEELDPCSATLENRNPCSSFKK